MNNLWIKKILNNNSSKKNYWTLRTFDDFPGAVHSSQGM